MMPSGTNAVSDAAGLNATGEDPAGETAGGALRERKLFGDGDGGGGRLVLESLTASTVQIVGTHDKIQDPIAEMQGYKHNYHNHNNHNLNNADHSHSHSPLDLPDPINTDDNNHMLHEAQAKAAAEVKANNSANGDGISCCLCCTIL
jgi:hypothetical protein